MTNINRLGSAHHGPLQRLRPWSTIVAYWVGLVMWLGTSAAWAQFLPLDPTQVVINAAGGQTAVDGLRIHLGNLGGIQVVRAGAGQYYGDTPTGPQGVNNGFFMAVGPAGSATVYGPQLDIAWTATAWTPVSQTPVTGQGTAADPYQAVTTVAAGGFRLLQTVRYVVPNVYFEVRLTLVPPAGNTQNVRIYHWIDTYLAGGDFGPAFWQPTTNPTVVGVEKSGQYDVLIQGNRAWNAYFSGRYYRPGALMELGGALDNTLDVDPSTDNGIAAQWDFAAPSSPVTWTYRLATGQSGASTSGDGVISGYESCDDGNTNNNDGCSSISQVEVGYTCVGSPSVCSVAAPPTITSANVTTFTVGAASTFSVTTSSAQIAAITTASTLPAGITLVDNGNGTATLSGTPAAGTAGTYPLTVTASSGVSPNADQSFTLSVNQAPAITSANATTFTVGTAGAFTITTSGTSTAAISTASPLPSGITLVDNGNGTAMLAGTPAAGMAGTYPLTITANSGVLPNANQNFTLLVNPAPAITSANATTFTVGTAGTFTVTTSGTPIAAISTASPLPPGITLVDNGNGTATLSGTAAYGLGGVYTLAITATNGASQTFTLTIASVTRFSSPTATGTGTATAQITGGGLACTFLGDAAFINASGVGTPVPLQFPHGLFSFTLRGCTGSVTLTITYPSVLPPASAYWKYGPQQKGAPSTWYKFVAAPNPASAVYTLTLADNALGDDDWDATTDIVDQGGPAASPVAAVPTVGATKLALLACLLAITGLLMLRRMDT